MKHLRDFILKIADDCLITGHRNSEWTGLGPVLEEDIAFSSMAQDQIGHAWALYKILHENLNEVHPDKLAFTRSETQMTNAQLCELPIGEYDFSLVRNFYFNHAQHLRFQSLVHSSYKPLADLAKKIKGELKYHIMHNDTWINQLGNGSEESKARMQSSINILYPYALGLFEKTSVDQQLIDEKICTGEDVLAEEWNSTISQVLESAGLKLPSLRNTPAIMGGRKGLHSEHLKPMLLEMTEVLRLDVNAEW